MQEGWFFGSPLPQITLQLYLGWTFKFKKLLHFIFLNHAIEEIMVADHNYGRKRVEYF